MSKERRLGRGLEALLGQPTAPVAKEETPTTGSNLNQHDGQTWLDIYAIDRNPFQPRTNFDQSALEGLVESIQEHGVLQPLVVRQEGDRYQLILGERRLRAATMAGWKQVPVQIRQADNRQMAELAIVENIQRKDLGALEKAQSFRRYLDEYGCTQEELAKRVHIDRSTVANLIRLLDLPESVKGKLSAGAISQGHARALLPLGDEREQVQFTQRIEQEGLSVRATEAAVTDWIRKADASPLDKSDARATIPSRSPHIAQLEQNLQRSMGTKVDLKQTSRGKGRIVVHFKNQEEFERIYDLLVKEEKRKRRAA